MNKKSEQGFINNNVLVILFIMCILLGGVFLISASFRKNIFSYKKQYEKISSAENLLKNIEIDMQDFLNYEEDLPQSAHIVNLIQKYEDFDFTITDVSSGINKNFLTQEQLDLIESEYTEVEYGWCNKKAYKEEIQDNYKGLMRKNEKIVLNELPVSNINFLDANTKQAFKECKLEEYCGKKTNFWKVECTFEDLLIQGIYCALPSEDLKKIEKYCLIQKNIKSEL